MNFRRLVLSLSALLLAGALLAAPDVATASAPPADGAGSVPASTRATDQRPSAAPGSRAVRFEVSNSADATIPCLPVPDGKLHTLRGRLVAPQRVLDGSAGPTTINVLVHDSGTAGWFFNLTAKPGYDYAMQLAKQGQTSLVIDRLGFGNSPLKNGNTTCVQAQVNMLHTVVQHLYSGLYDFVGSNINPPHAGRIVVQGHGNGATIAQLEAAKYSDTAGLVLLAPTTTSPTRLAAQTLGAQSLACLGGRGFAPFGATSRDYRDLLFRTAPKAVQRAAVQRRASTPCGEVAGLASAVASASAGPSLDVPVLVLRGGADSRNDGRASVASSDPVVRHTFGGAGSALVLEKAAPAVRSTVLRWLRAL